MRRDLSTTYRSSPGFGAITRRDVEDLYSRMRDSHEFIESRRDAGMKEKTSRAIQSVETAAGAAGVGVLAGRLGTTSIGNTAIPLGLALGFAGHAAAFFGLTGVATPHVQSLADGAIAGWIALWGAGQGTQMRQKAGLPIGPITAGVSSTGCVGCGPSMPPSMPGYAPRMMGPGGFRPGARPLTEAELQAMSQNYR